jgi:hypothetical protein
MFVQNVASLFFLKKFFPDKVALSVELGAGLKFLSYGYQKLLILLCMSYCA